MVFQSYKTDHPNHVHQLVVSVSRHLYVTSNGKFKYQKKAFEAKLDRPDSYTKKHIVHYLIRDHFSGLFYVEITDTKNIFSVFEFLYRAWSRKDHHPLCGIPYALTVPKNVKALWSNITPFLEEITIQSVDVTSGFQGGIRDIRTWEEDLRCGLYKSGYPPDYSEVSEYAPYACAQLNTFNCRGKSKAEVWQENLPEDIYLPVSQEAFQIKRVKIKRVRLD